MDTEYQTLSIQRSTGRVDVKLQRPEVRNAFDAQMIQELTGAFESLAKDPSIRVVVLSGEGPMFSAGADIQWMRASIDLTEEQNKAAFHTSVDTMCYALHLSVLSQIAITMNISFNFCSHTFKT